MKYLLNKYKIILIIALLINIPILIMGTIRTNKSIILKGDTTLVSSLITVEPQKEEKGSFSTIYVVSVNHSTILHNLIAGFIPSTTISDMSSSSLHYTDKETILANKIMYNSARMTSLISAYNKASSTDSSLTLNYTYDGVSITSYKVNSNFRIGDIIYKIYDKETNLYYDTSDYTSFLYALNNYQTEEDIIYYKRDSNLIEFTLDKENISSFSGYSTYSVDFSKSNFNVKYKSTNIGGPSGGLLQALEIYNQLTDFDYSKGLKISGTGTINQNGVVGTIGGVRQKIFTAFDDRVDVFFCPPNNYEDALEAYNTLENKERMALVRVETIDDAINYLVGVENA